MNSKFVEENSQLIQVLCVNSSCNAGLTAAQALAALQAKFPDAGWNDETFVQSLLSEGLRQGRYCRVTADSYTVNVNMAIVNPFNRQYQNLCPRIQKVITGTDLQSTNYGSPFQGRRACCSASQ